MREHDIRPQALLDEFFTRLRRDAARLVESLDVSPAIRHGAEVLIVLDA